MLDYTPTPETWVNIGKGHWVDPFWTWKINEQSVPVEGDIKIEKSVQHPDRYCAKIYTDADYVTINTENPGEVCISPYSTVSTDGTIITVTQNCAENGMDGSKYGILSNGKVTIPGDSFVASFLTGVIRLHVVAVANVK